MTLNKVNKLRNRKNEINLDDDSKFKTISSMTITEPTNKTIKKFKKNNEDLKKSKVHFEKNEDDDGNKIKSQKKKSNLKSKTKVGKEKGKEEDEHWFKEISYQLDQDIK